MSDFTCDRCQRVCKDLKGLRIHQNKCGIEKEKKVYQCSYCERTFNVSCNLERHILTCQEKQNQEALQEQEKVKQNEERIKQDLIQEREFYNKQLKDLETRHLQQLKILEQDHFYKLEMREQDLRKAHDDITKQKEQYNELKLLYQNLQNDYKEEKLQSRENKAQAFKMANRALEKPSTTILQNYNSTNIQQNNYPILNFNPSSFTGKINPPDVVVRNVQQLVQHITRQGFSNYYRITDRSRNVVVWKNENGEEIRDSNCSQLSESIVNALNPELIVLKQYWKECLENIQKSSEPDYSYMISIQNNLGFCQDLINKNQATMELLQKELVKIGKNKKDATVDQVKDSSYINFKLKLEQALFPFIRNWIFLDIKDIGLYLSKKLKSHYKIEGSSLDDRYIVICNDNEQPEMIYKKLFDELFTSVIQTNLIHHSSKDIICNLLEESPKYDREDVQQKWIWFEFGDSELSEQVLTGLIQGYTN